MAKQMNDAETAHAYRLLEAQNLIEAYWTARQQQRARDKAMHEKRVAMARKEAGKPIRIPADKRSTPGPETWQQEPKPQKIRMPADVHKRRP